MLTQKAIGVTSISLACLFSLVSDDPPEKKVPALSSRPQPKETAGENVAAEVRASVKQEKTAPKGQASISSFFSKK